MPLEISRNDIRNIYADAIVDPTDVFLSGSAGTDRLIHELAGSRLDERCRELGPLEAGEAVITDSYDMDNCRYIIHTRGPIYEDGYHDEEKILSSCYRSCLETAREYGLESIAFPLISSGSFMFPKGMALKIATDTISGFLMDNEMDVCLLVYDRESFDTASRLYQDIRSYIDENLSRRKRRQGIQAKFDSISSMEMTDKMETVHEEQMAMPFIRPERFEPDESFSECLIRMIDERKMLDPEVYKRANIDRKHFNHIKNTRDYRPKKETAVALAIGMRLDIDDTNTLLERAGFVLSRSSRFDLIIRYCIENGIYNIFEINEILFAEDQKTLGC